MEKKYSFKLLIDNTFDGIDIITVLTLVQYSQKSTIKQKKKKILKHKTLKLHANQKNLNKYASIFYAKVFL